MARLINIVTLSLPGQRDAFHTEEEFLTVVLQHVKGTASYKPDLICLPEELLRSSFLKETSKRNQLRSSFLDALKDCAQTLNSNIICSLKEPIDETHGYITSYVMNRQGTIVGCYRKRHHPEGALKRGYVPGKDLPVFDLDIGRVGILTCFDIGYREDWEALKQKGAELVVWNAAYDGGTLLNAYAQVYSYYIVSSVWHGQHATSRIISPMGETLFHSDFWDPVCYGRIDIETELFHLDGNMDALQKIREDFGDQVEIRYMQGGNMCTLSSTSSQVSILHLKEQYGLVSYEEYHKASKLACELENK